MDKDDALTMGQVSARSGFAPSALRYYEEQALITSSRTAGSQRRYRRAVLRRLAVIKAAQQVGLSLDEVRQGFGDLALDAAPTRQQWARMSARWRPQLDRRIADLVAVRDNLDSCIGCGCLSMRQCRLYNPDDALAGSGEGARRLFPEPRD